MLALWLSQSDKDGPYSAAGNLSSVSQLSVEVEGTSSESTTFSPMCPKPLERVGEIRVQEEGASLVDGLSASMYLPQDILAFCGSWQ